jgi:hypothetical protein
LESVSGCAGSGRVFFFALSFIATLLDQFAREIGPRLQVAHVTTEAMSDIRSLADDEAVLHLFDHEQVTWIEVQPLPNSGWHNKTSSHQRGL